MGNEDEVGMLTGTRGLTADDMREREREAEIEAMGRREERSEREDAVFRWSEQVRSKHVENSRVGSQ